jgi:hypothetical protein
MRIANAASSLFLFLVLRVLAKAGVKDGDVDVVAAVDAYFRAHPLSPAAQAALAAFLDAFLPDVDVDAQGAMGARLDQLGIATSSRPVGATPPPPGAVRGGLAARFEQAKKR